MPETRYTDAQLAKLAETPFTGGRGLAGDLAAEILELRASLAAIKAADPDLFDPTGGTDRGAAHETYGSAGHNLREKYLAAIGVDLDAIDDEEKTDA
ncbi:hypothetical protein [Nocardia sp. NPDC055049]